MGTDRIHPEMVDFTRFRRPTPISGERCRFRMDTNSSLGHEGSYRNTETKFHFEKKFRLTPVAN
jgi:hypothetical protein